MDRLPVEGVLAGEVLRDECRHAGWKSIVVEVGGQEEMERQRPAIHSFIPSEFAANKQTLRACCFVLGGMSVSCSIRLTGSIVSSGHHLKVPC